VAETPFRRTVARVLNLKFATYVVSRIASRIRYSAGRLGESMVRERMVFLGRAVLVAGVVSLCLAACGRRGALEPPPEPGAQKQTSQSAVDDDVDDGAILPSASPAPRKRTKGFKMPDKPFVLDPLL
jgi:predicted small lipoprotein YifL